MWRRGILLAALLMSGCSGESDEGNTSPEPKREASPPAPSPDAGTRAGHGADAPRVSVPRDDPSPPTATIVLATPGGRTLGEASEPPGRQPPAVEELREAGLQGTTIGRDPGGGVARVRVSLRERITCRAEGRRTERLRTRYFPPPQIERIRSNVDARLPSEKRRTLALTLGRGRCGADEAVEVEAQLWGEAINGTGLEAVTPHLRLFWVR